MTVQIKDKKINDKVQGHSGDVFKKTSTVKEMKEKTENNSNIFDAPDLLWYTSNFLSDQDISQLNSVSKDFCKKARDILNEKYLSQISETSECNEFKIIKTDNPLLFLKQKKINLYREWSKKNYLLMDLLLYINKEWESQKRLNYNNLLCWLIKKKDECTRVIGLLRSIEDIITASKVASFVLLVVAAGFISYGGIILREDPGLTTEWSVGLGVGIVLLIFSVALWFKKSQFMQKLNDIENMLNGHIDSLIGKVKSKVTTLSKSGVFSESKVVRPG